MIREGKWGRIYREDKGVCEGEGKKARREAIWVKERKGMWGGRG